MAKGKSTPYLYELDGVKRCSICKKPVPDSGFSVRKAFAEHVLKAHESEQAGNNIAKAPTQGEQWAHESAKRILCPVRTSLNVLMLTCTRCAWFVRVEGNDRTSIQVAFESHCCDDYPRDEGI